MQATTYTARKRLAWALALACCAAASGAALAQEKASATGDGWHLGTNHLGIQRLDTPGIDRDYIELEDMKRFEANEPVTRFAVAHTHKVSPAHFGNWDQPSADTLRWRIVLGSPKALSINLGFSKFNLPEGAELTLLDPHGKPAFRSFTAADNDAHGQLWTPMVAGEEVTVVLTVPAKSAERVQLEIGAINHGYRGLGEIPWFAKSGACNVDVVCPEGDDWREQIRSVAALTLNGTDQCSGALVNNVRGDLTAYFLTAAHCDFGSTSGAAGMVAYWNYENSTCRAPGSGASGGAGDGPLTQFNTGAQLRANRAATDFTLVEFDDPIDSAYNVYWAGIDARDQTTSGAIAIHHPGVEEKRISFENDPTTITTYLQEAVPGDGTHIRVTDWDLGTTEGGSSGSPLFSPDKHIIGQLHGGYASCSSQTSDWYGRVAVSWAAGGSAATQLRDWLDPDNTGTLVIDGRNEIEAPFNLALEPAALDVCSADGSAAVDVDVLQEDAGFTDNVDLSVANVPPGATAAFDVTSVPTPGSAVLTIGGLAGVAGGSYALQVSATDGTDTVSKNLPIVVSAGTPAAAALTAPANGATGLSTSVTLTWAAVPGAQSYEVLVDDDPAFGSPQVIPATGTTATVSGLSVETVYHWQVVASNGCGEGVASAVWSFETGVQYCATPNLAIPDNVPAGVTSTLTVPESGNITDLNLGLDISHTYIGDLRVTLTKGATTVAVLARPSGCSGNDADIMLDDAATLSVQTNCTSGTNPTQAYIAGEDYRPNAPLSAFNDTDLAGTWTLTISDNAGIDVGTLNGWCLLPTAAPTVNLPPEAVPIPAGNATVGIAFSRDLSAYFSDPNGDTLSYAATGLPAWATLNPTTGVLSGTPAAGDVGVSTITVTVTENHPDGGTASETYTLTVEGGNQDPIGETIPDASAAVDVAFVYDTGSYFSDPDEDTLTFSATGLPAWATIDTVTGIISGTPALADVGDATVVVTATDPDGADASQSFVLSVVEGNAAPVAGKIDDQTVAVGTPLAVPAGEAFSDPNDDTLTFSATGLPAWASIDPATGEITGTPATGDEGVSDVTVTATEDTEDALTATASFTLTVTEAPGDLIFADGFED